tara:strand:+ start:1340 stop:1597 length:258 start_codon:yes stop_codon:yes gene_type:complete
MTIKTNKINKIEDDILLERLNKERNKKTINKIINERNNTWEVQLPLYLDLYSKLNDQGKKEMQNQVSTLGKLVDIVQKAKNKGVK